MTNEFTQLGFFAFLVSLVLLSLYSVAFFFSADKVGIDYMLAQVLHAVVAIGLAWLASRVFQVILVQYYKAKTNNYVPRYIITFFNWGLTIFTFLFISVSIFEQDAWKLITAGGIVAAGLAFSLQGIVLDAVSGLILDVDRTYKKGDWIRLDDHTTGRVLNTNWRYIEVLTEHFTSIVIPNRELISNPYEILTHGTDPYAEHIDISIDHNMPAHRAERVMLDALMSIEEVVRTGICGVFAKSTNEGGVVFQVRFGIEDYAQIRPIRNKVIQTILSHMHKSGLKVSETLGEYVISKSEPFQYQPDYPVEDLLQHISLFTVLTPQERKTLSKKAIKREVDRGDDLIVIGDDTDSLVIIAEGVVDVIVPQKKGKITENQVISTLRSGNFVGDRALLLGEKRSATVRAKTPVLVYEITKEAVKPILEKRPALLDQLSLVMAERELDTSQKLDIAKQKPKKTKTLAESLKNSMKTFFDL